MTREEIERSFQYNMTDAFIKWDKAVNAEYKEENEEAFYQGAYAAQKYFIEKACEWLGNNFVCFLQGAKRGIYSNQFVNVNEMVDNFKKAMEE